MAVKFISGLDHYKEVIARAAAVKRSLWIGTADIKDLYVKSGSAHCATCGRKSFCGDPIR